MSSQPAKPSPTDPGPFQKYLFSGACYVQVGECYRLLLVALAQGKPLSAQHEIVARLAAMWHDQAMRQTAMAALMPGAAGVTEPGMTANQFLMRINSELQQIGHTAATSLLAKFDATDGDDVPEFSTFFEQWVACCGVAWDELARSDWFADAFGRAVNHWIHSRP